MSKPVDLSFPFLQEGRSVLYNQTGERSPEGSPGSWEIPGPFRQPIEVPLGGGHDPDLDLPLPRAPNVNVRRVMIKGRETEFQSWDGERIDPAEDSALLLEEIRYLISDINAIKYDHIYGRLAD
jgi:hypothetical protein